MAGEGKTWSWATGFQKVGIRKEERGSFMIIIMVGILKIAQNRSMGLSLLSCYSKDRVIRTIAIPH